MAWTFSDGTRAQRSPAAIWRPGMAEVVHRNIRAAYQRRAQMERSKSASEKVSDAITDFAGSMWCVYFHALWFGGWIIINAGWVRGIKPFDPFPFVMLAMIASVEAIFLSTFILITQNRMQRFADRRAELDLQINLLSEHELTRAIRLLDAIAQAMKVARPAAEEIEDITRDVDPLRVADEIDKAEAEQFGIAASGQDS